MGSSNPRAATGQGGCSPSRNGEGRRITRSARRSLFAVACATIIAPVALLLQSCGLPGIQPFLEPPVVPTSASNPDNSLVFTFDNQPQTSPDDFYGFELYYKFYDNTNNNAASAYQSDTTTLSSQLTGPSQLIALGYRRVYLYPPGYTQGTTLSTPATPLISITDPTLKTSIFPVTIDFTGFFASSGAQVTNFYPPVSVNGTKATVSANGQTGGLEIGRYLGNPADTGISGSNIIEGFGAGDFALDQGTNNGYSPPGDVPSTIVPTSATTTGPSILLGLYAIAYGLVNFSIPIYSTPTPLGYITYTLTSFTQYSSPANR